jgi:hypothetical protein
MKDGEMGRRINIKWGIRRRKMAGEGRGREGRACRCRRRKLIYITEREDE